MSKLTRLYVFGLTVALGVMAWAGNALAASGDPPTFDATTLQAPFNDYGSTLLEGIVIILGVVLVVAAAFTLVKIGVGALKSWVGKAKATSAVR